MINTLRKRLKTSGEAGTFDKDKFEKILNLLEKVGLNQDDVGILCQLPLDNWYSELRMTFWRSEIHQKLNRIQLTDEEKKEAVFMLLQLENKEGEKICSQIFYDLLDNQPVNRWPEMRNILQTNFDSTEEERTEQDLVNTILNKMMQHSKLPESIQNTMALSVNTDDCFKKNNSDVLKSSWLRQILNLSQDSSLMEFLNVYDQIVELKMGFPLRNTQKVAIVTLLKSDANTLFQVSTGEGKSLIVAGVAIGRAKAGQTVDIITSNDVLAKRDSESKLAEIYSAFRIKVGNNCSKKEEKRADGYKCQVVYGQMSNFQRDYLLDTFYGREIRGDRKFNSVIVDEVDCMLLDRGNNVLYLSHDIPGMEMLESLYVFVWDKVKKMDSQSLDADELKKYTEEYSVPESTILDIKKAFDIMDVNQNGSIQPSEFQAVLEQLGLADEDGIATKALIGELDLNSNGFVDFDEFLKFSLKKIDDKVETEDAERVFGYYDGNSTGKIDVNDLGNVAKILGQKMSEKDLGKMLRLLDFDGDGFVEKKDFLEMMLGTLNLEKAGN